MDPPTILVVLILSMGVIGTDACDAKIVKAIEDKIIKEDFLEYINNKVTVTLWIARKHVCKDCLAGSVRCAWTKLTQDKTAENNLVKVIHFYRTKIFPMPGVVKDEEERHLTRLDSGVYVERNAFTDESEYFLYPLFFDKDAGVIAYHRCAVHRKHPWYTVIAVLNGKFSHANSGKFTPGQPSWEVVREATDLIKGYNLRHHKRVGKAISDPYVCKNRINAPGL